MDSQEANLRSEIISACRRLDRRDLVAATDGNVSCRAGEDRILITPSGVSKGDVGPDELILATLDGGVPPGARRPSSEMEMHLHVYRHRPDVRAIVHAHPPVATALTLAGISFDSKVLPEVWLTIGPVPTAPYATPSTEDVPRSLAPFVGSCRAILLERHGAVTFGKGVLEACMRMEKLEHAAKILFHAAMLEGRKAPAPMGEVEIARLEEAFSKLKRAGE